MAGSRALVGARARASRPRRDATGQAVAYTYYFRRDENEARQANVLTHDEVRRIAASIASCPSCYSARTRNDNGADARPNWWEMQASGIGAEKFVCAAIAPCAMYRAHVYAVSSSRALRPPPTRSAFLQTYILRLGFSDRAASLEVACSAGCFLRFRAP
jgi:hypothetical protein